VPFASLRVNCNRKLIEILQLVTQKIVKLPSSTAAKIREKAAGGLQIGK
jgi:hypothetical protein